MELGSPQQLYLSTIYCNIVALREGDERPKLPKEQCTGIVFEILSQLKSVKIADRISGSEWS